MSSPESSESPEVPPAPPSPPCRYLRNKGMHVYTDGFGEEHEGYDNTIYWCQQTMKDFGPDDGFVGAHECRDPSRPCYQPL
jgi:hypothetical protein